MNVAHRSPASARLCVTLALAAAFACVPLAAGASGVNVLSRPVQRPGILSFASSKIQHIVVVVQENRSFDDLFYGFPGANTATTGLNSKGQTIPLQPIGFEVEYEIDHFLQDFI